MQGMTCEHCRHWQYLHLLDKTLDEHKDSLKRGTWQDECSECRRHAPVAGKGWPRTYHGDWCSEFEARDLCPSVSAAGREREERTLPSAKLFLDGITDKVVIRAFDAKGNLMVEDAYDPGIRGFEIINMSTKASVVIECK